MALQIEWTEQALGDLLSVLQYLQENWSDQIAEKFAETTYARVQRLSEHAGIGIRSETKTSIRSISLSKHNRLYYQADDKKLIVLNIFDVRQHPNKNPWE